MNLGRGCEQQKKRRQVAIALVSYKKVQGKEGKRERDGDGIPQRRLHALYPIHQLSLVWPVRPMRGRSLPIL